VAQDGAGAARVSKALSGSIVGWNLNTRLGGARHCLSWIKVEHRRRGAGRFRGEAPADISGRVCFRGGKPEGEDLRG
jgi:hypothetical protein